MAATPRARCAATSCCPSAPSPATATPARSLVDDVYLPLAAARGTLIETLATYFLHGGSIEATARALFVHPNTVRYRLEQVAEVTGLAPDPAARRLHPADRPGPRTPVRRE